MKIYLTGINGYLGICISKELRALGHQVNGIERSLLYGSSSALANRIKGSDIIINLAGASILRRWTPKMKKIIYDSRVRTTGNLVFAINSLPLPIRPKKIISASAIGIYQAGLLHDESSLNYSKEYIGNMVKAWEAQLDALPESIHKTIFRIGLVLGKDSKTIKNLIIPLKFGLGGKIGSGNQAFPFVHERDVARAFVWAVENTTQNQIFNLVAPEQITNKQFVKTFASKLNRPAFLPLPGLILKLIFGQASSLLLKTPAVEPTSLLSNNFKFIYSTIESVLSEILA